MVTIPIKLLWVFADPLLGTSTPDQKSTSRRVINLTGWDMMYFAIFTIKWKCSLSKRFFTLTLGTPLRYAVKGSTTTTPFMEKQRQLQQFSNTQTKERILSKLCWELKTKQNIIADADRDNCLKLRSLSQSYPTRVNPISASHSKDRHAVSSAWYVLCKSSSVQHQQSRPTDTQSTTVHR